MQPFLAGSSASFLATVTTIDALTPFSAVTKIWAEPSPTAVTKPVDDTVAIFSFDEDQVNVVSSWFSGLATNDNCNSSPINNSGSPWSNDKRITRSAIGV